MPELPPIPASLWATLDEVGPCWSSDIRTHARRIAEGFSAILAHAPKIGTASRNLAYGMHPRQVLDVYAPPGVRRAPVVMFVHGGAFIEGDKERTPEMYANVCWFMTRNDIVGINVEYRLAPEVKFPGMTEDIAAAVQWAKRNVERFGGDPQRIYLFGHSAGAFHAGSYAYDPRFQPPGGAGVAGLIVLSGRVRAENSAENPHARSVEAYFGNDAEAMAQASMVRHVARDSVPTLIGMAEYESPLIDVHCVELVHRIAEVKRRAPPFFRLRRHTHSSTVAQINTADDLVGPQIVEFIRAGG
jgi:acetyl esterase